MKEPMNKNKLIISPSLGAERSYYSIILPLIPRSVKFKYLIQNETLL